MAVNIVDTAFGGIAPPPSFPTAGSAGSGRPAAATRTKTEAEGGTTGASAGLLVPITAIQPGVVEGLKASVRDATARLNSLITDSQVGARLQQILGKPGDSGSIGQAVQEVVKSVAAPAADPTQAAAAVTQAVTTLTTRLATATRAIQGLRGEVDKQLGSAVAQAQASLQQVARINDKIAVSGAAGATNPDLATQRDAALGQLSASLDFESFVRSDGTAAVFTKSGTPLVDGKAARLACAAAQASESASANGSPSGPTADGADIGGQLSAGTIQALLQARDTSLPNLQNQLDTLAQTLQARVNQSSNRSIAGAGARASYLGARRVADPAEERISVSGGDTMISVVGPDGRAKATTSLTMLMAQAQQAAGSPAAGSWPVARIATALNGWLNTRLGTQSASYLHFDEEGRLSINLPAATGYRLAFRDQRSTTYQSSLSADPNKPLGLSGALTFTDSLGNRMSTAPRDVQPGDSLASIAARLNALGGLKAELSGSADGTRLTVTSSVAADLSLAPDAAGATAVAKLGLAPAADQPAEDAAVNHIRGRTGMTLTSTLMPNATTALGINGPLTVQDQSGSPLLSLAADPGWTLNTLAARINAAAGSSGLAASVVAVGNQVALKLSAPADQRIGLAAPSIAGDALGLAPPADRVVSGFANFFGLNDVFVADPADAFDAKAPTGLFATTATPGTAGALALNPDLHADPSRLADPALLNPLADMLSNPLNLAAAGALPRGSYNLAQYADAIAAATTAAAATARQQATYQQVLVDSLAGRQAGNGSVDMNDSLANLATYQQAYRDSAQVISTMAQLFGSLGATVH